jgi:hypothetical protein
MTASHISQAIEISTATTTRSTISGTSATISRTPQPPGPRRRVVPDTVLATPEKPRLTPPRPLASQDQGPSGR